MGRMRGLWLAFFVALLLPSSANAQDYPSRVIRIVMPFTAGGGADLAGRVIAAKMSELLKQPIIIDNRPGANGRIGVEYALKAAPDGYTLLMGSNGPLTINPHLMRVSYDPVRDLVPISLLFTNEAVLIVNPSFPAKNVSEFVSIVKADPGKYAFANSGIGGIEHMGAELIANMAGLKVRAVPYKGDSPALADVIAGQVPIKVSVFASAAPYIKSGQVRAIAALGTKRFSNFPDLPTFAEAGYPRVTVASWFGLFGPAQLPSGIQNKLNQVVVAVLNDPDIRARLEEQNTTPTPSSSSALAEFMQDESAKWEELIRETGIKIEN
jgi:tripartite-type tricarboxylate transporter receptor subunit TctC